MCLKRREQNPYESWDRIRITDGALCQCDWTEADDTIDTVETSRLRCGTNGLGGDSQAAEGNSVGVFSSRERATTVADLDGAASRLACRGLLASTLSTTPCVRS